MLKYTIKIFSIIFLANICCSAAVITVDDDGPADYTKIQDAINVAVNGDTVEVSVGHYYENIDFRGKAITVKSTDPMDPTVVEATIIDANGDGIVVSFHMGERTDSVFTGFTVTGGYAIYGAGICCWGDSAPTIINSVITENKAADIVGSLGAGIYGCNGIIDNCIINGNSVQMKGGGIYCISDNLIIRNCTIIDNSASRGGGIFLSSASPEIKNCTIIYNSADEWGGGVNCNSSSNPNISNCCIISNKVVNYEGGGIYCDFGNPLINSCIIAGNLSVNSNGGGIYCQNSNPIIWNCTIVGNIAAYGGSGVHCGNSGSAVIINNVITNNISGTGIYALYSDPIISFNNIWGNPGGDYGGWAWAGDHDISVDPCFVQAGYWDDKGTPVDPSDDEWVDGDYHLRYDSLCINVGDPSFVPEPGETDMDGESRIRLGRVDMGADEAGSNPADFDENGIVDNLDLNTLCSAWLSINGGAGWNPLCDISKPADEVIDLKDWASFSNQWSWQASWYIP